jgi:type I restriction enzyme, S subunit
MTSKSIALAEIAADKGLVGGPFGSSLVQKDYTDSGVPVIRGTNLNAGRYLGGDFAFVSTDKVRTDLARNTAAPGDLVFTQRGTLGQVALVPDEPFSQYVVSQSQMRLRVNPKIADPTFVYYACSANTFIKQVEDHAISTGVPHINLGILSKLQIPLPDFHLQTAIAEVLGALDDKIATNNRLAATADEYILAQHTNAVRSGGAVDVPLFDVFDVDFGEAFKGSSFSEPGTGRALIRIRDLKTYSSQVWTTESRGRETLVQPGDVLVGMDAEFRATAWLGSPGVLNQRVCRVRGKTVGPAFVRDALRSPLSAIENYKTGTTVIHLNKKDLEEARVILPEPRTLRSFEDQTEGLYRTRVSAAAESRTLAATRDALLPQLMSGKLQVREAAELINETV